MTLLATSLLAGIGVGVSIAAPVGPASMLCVQQTLARGLPTGLAIGFGVATVHLVYSAVAAASGAAFVGAWQNAAPLSLASGIVLLVFSIRVFRRVVVVREPSGGPGSLASCYCGAVGFGFLNPITPLLFAAAVPSLVSQGSGSIPITIGGVFLGSLGWWVLLTWSVGAFRKKITSKILESINKTSALFMAYLAIRMIMPSLIL